jgi:hypothetical protein
MASSSSPSNCGDCTTSESVPTVTGNNILDKNFVYQSIMSPAHWEFLGIDLKKVEKASYAPASKRERFEVSEDDLRVLRFALQTMMERYKMMEEFSVHEYKDIPGSALPDGKNTRLRLELSPSTAQAISKPNVDEVEEGSNEAEAIRIIGSIARLGEPAEIELILPIMPSWYSFTDPQSDEGTF